MNRHGRRVGASDSAPRQTEKRQTQRETEGASERDSALTVLADNDAIVSAAALAALEKVCDRKPNVTIVHLSVPPYS